MDESFLQEHHKARKTSAAAAASQDTVHQAFEAQHVQQIMQYLREKAVAAMARAHCPQR